MASERRIIPDLYFPDEDQELQTSSVEGEGGRGQGGGLPGRKTVDLTPEGFIPIHKLTLEDLPEPIRTQEFLQYILDVSTEVVRVNNNGLSDLRPDDDEFKRAKRRSLTGSGILFGGRAELLITNQHVLFNEEELRKSTFDVFYDYHFGDKDDEKKRFKRSVRTNGKFFGVKSSKDDIVQAVYDVKDAMKAHVKDHADLGIDGMVKQVCKLFEHDAVVRNKPSVVCLISHPMGQPKHVSFGEMVHYDMPSRTVYHTAPSKPGSSGGRVIVFSWALLPHTIVHVGTDLLDGKKYKYARICHFLSSLNSWDLLQVNGENTRSEQEIPTEKFCERASASVEIMSLSAFIPIFGAFLLRLEETRLDGLDMNILTPCKVLQTDEPLTSYKLKQCVKNSIESLAQLVSSIAQVPPSYLLDTSDLDSLLESQGPCYCQSIVKMMERGVKLEDATVTECFLSPYTTAAKMSSDGDVTWPWLKGRDSELDKHDTMEGCLLRKCLHLADEGVSSAMLLLMIARANVDIKHLHLRSSDSSSTKMDRDYENQGKTVHEQSKQEPQLEENTEKRYSENRHSPPLAEEKKLSSSAAEVGRDRHRLTSEVLAVIQIVFSFTRMAFVMRLRNKPQNVTSEQEESEDISKLYSRCLAVSEHCWQHEWQTHPDTEHNGQDDRNVNWCKCGRPGTRDVLIACVHLETFTFAEKSMSLPDMKNILKSFEDFYWIRQNTSNFHFLSMIKTMQDHSSDMSLPEGHVVLTTLDVMDSFPHGRHSLMFFLASEEAFLYNVCLLARQISKHFQPWYFAFPVSVYGRPGNWPGNVTPPEVQCSAWRLIQDAIMASGFRPAVLAALEKDAERREKLIDLYVDMKQLKWQGKIQPHLFGLYLDLSRTTMTDHVLNPVPFIHPTHYFVWYATYLVCPKILTSQSFMSPQCPLM